MGRLLGRKPKPQTEAVPPDAREVKQRAREAVRAIKAVQKEMQQEATELAAKQKQLEVQRQLVEERLLILEPVGGTDRACHLNNATAVDRVDAPGARPTGEHPEHSGTAAEVDHDIAGPYDLVDRPPKSVDPVLISQKVTVLVKL